LVTERDVQLTDGQNSMSIDLTSREKGVYFLEIKSENATRTVKLIVI
jgi:hypothetical protein